MFEGDLDIYVVLERIRERKTRRMFNMEKQPIYWDKPSNKCGKEKRREEICHKRYRINKALRRYRLVDSAKVIHRG